VHGEERRNYEGRQVRGEGRWEERPRRKGLWVKGTGEETRYSEISAQLDEDFNERVNSQFAAMTLASHPGASLREAALRTQRKC
jgi:hypothetical protein